MDRVFLDANVLFSAAYTLGSRLVVLWELAGVELVTSALAVEEARRNLQLQSPAGIDTLANLAASLDLVAGAPKEALPEGVSLPAKDEPILAAAIACGATHLLTGDKRHFGDLFGQRIAGVLIQTPSQYLASRKWSGA